VFAEVGAVLGGADVLDVQVSQARLEDAFTQLAAGSAR
jgi:hypothetical protein